MLIVDGHVVDPATGLHEIADVLIEQDCIKKIYVRTPRRAGRLQRSPGKWTSCDRCKG